jgi:ABC-type sugar transport system substrate-binding protein
VRITIVARSKTDRTWPVLSVLAAEFSRYEEKLKVTLLAPDNAGAAHQKQLIESLTPSDADVACVDPLDPLALGPVVADLVTRGVPVVLIGRDIPGSSRSAFCGPSEFELGKAAALAAGRITHGRSNSIMLLHAGSSEETAATRLAGFKQGFPLIGGLRLLKEVNCNGESLLAEELVKSESHRYPRVAGWVFLGEWPLRAVSGREQPLHPGLGAVLCSTDTAWYPQLRDGRIDALLGYDYRRAVEEALFAAQRIAQSATRGFAPEINIPPEVITRGDLPTWEQRWRDWARRDGAPAPAASRPAGSP